MRSSCLVPALVCVACSPPPRGTGLDAPVVSYDLPAELVEVSALVALDAHTVACVEDEHGIVYSIDLATGAVVARRAFGPDGDYEGLTRAGDVFWVLRSDGALLRLAERDGVLAVAETVELRVGHDDFEGLAWDPLERVLLVAAKDPPEGGKDERDLRRVFAVDPADVARAPRLVLSVSVERIVAEARALGIPLPTKRKGKGKERVDLELRFSAIAVHPTTGDLHLLSAADRALVVLDRAGALRALHFFDPDRLPKPEGIAFLESGDLVVASEGEDGPARVQVFAAREVPGQGDAR